LAALAVQSILSGFHDILPLVRLEAAIIESAVAFRSTCS
jgi:hypothetical protein